MLSFIAGCLVGAILITAIFIIANAIVDAQEK